MHWVVNGIVCLYGWRYYAQVPGFLLEIFIQTDETHYYFLIVEEKLEAWAVDNW